MAEGRVLFDMAKEAIERHLIAQKNAALPIDQGGLGLPANNTAMDRAKAIGFRTEMPLYHGTNKDFDEFKLFEGEDATRSVSRSPVGKLGVSLARDPALAAEFANLAGGEGMNVIPVLHRAENPASVPLPNDVTNSEVFGSVVDAWKDGRDGLLFKNYTMPSGKKGDQFILVRAPNQIRSKFAAFDPAQKDSANILASAAPVAAGLGILGTGLSSQDAMALPTHDAQGNYIGPDIGSITPVEHPYLDAAANAIDKYAVTPIPLMEHPLSGVSNELRNFGRDRPASKRLEDAMGAVADVSGIPENIAAGLFSAGRNLFADPRIEQAPAP